MPNVLQSDLRTDLVTTRLTPAERERLIERAKDIGISPSKFVHHALRQALNDETDSKNTKVILAYLELLTEDVARIETVITYVVANLKVGNDLTAAVVDQFSVAASKRKMGYAAARLEAARIKASKEQDRER